MRVILVPLEETYETIQVRTTELESFHTCAFKHKFAKQDFSNNDALLFGSLTHAVLQAYFFKPEAWYDTLDILCRGYEDRCKNIRDYIILTDANRLREQYSLICSEYQVVVEIEMGSHLVILSGTIDAISKEPNNGPYTLIDFKTSKAEWKPEQFDAKMQKFIYPWLLSKLVWEEMVKGFDYIIYTKHVTPRLQVLKYQCNRQEIEDLIKTILTDYTHALKTNMWNPKICTSCFFCPLKTTCPLKQLGTFDEF